MYDSQFSTRQYQFLTKGIRVRDFDVWNVKMKPKLFKLRQSKDTLKQIGSQVNFLVRKMIETEKKGFQIDWQMWQQFRQHF